MRFGPKNRGGAKATVDMVIEIRQRYDAGETQSALCKEFKLSLVQIGRIVRRESWQGVEELPSDKAIEESASRVAALTKGITEARARSGEGMLEELREGGVQKSALLPVSAETMRRKAELTGGGEGASGEARTVAGNAQVHSKEKSI